jgi:hypothetical protein
MTKQIISSLILSALAVSTTTIARAATIDFEDPGVAKPSGTFNFAGKTVTSRGFTFTSSLNNAPATDELILSNNSPFTGDAANGTTVLGIQDARQNNTDNNLVTLTAVGNQLFSLSSLDIGEFGLGVDYARTVTVIGTVSGGGPVSKTISIDGIVDGPNPPGTENDFQTATFDSSWTNLLRVTFLGSGSPGDPLFGDTSGLDGFSLDNLVATVNSNPPPSATTPEPSSLVGLIAVGGWGAIATLRRLRRSIF